MAFTVNHIAPFILASLISASPTPTVQPTPVSTPDMLPQTVEDAKETWQQILAPKIEDLEKNFDGSLGIYIEDVGDGTKLMHNADKKYYLASVIKLFVMARIYKLINDKRLSMTDTVRITNSKYRDGAGYINWLSPGNKVSIKELIQSMMNKSDNAATDILIDVAGLEPILESARAYGVHDLDKMVTLLDVRKDVFRNLNPLGGQLTALDFIELWKVKNFDRKLKLFSKLINKPELKLTEADLSRAFDEFYKTETNSASLVSVAEFLRMLLNGEVVSQKTSNEMINVLKRCETGENRIKKGMPPGFEFAHKTGTQFKRICDVGIAFGPNQRFLILMCAIDFKSRENAEDTLYKASAYFFNTYMGGGLNNLPEIETVPRTY